MKIAAYIQRKYAKEAYKNECYNARLWVGLEVVIDSLRRAGYEVEYTEKNSVENYDVILVSITADCDWLSFLEERKDWKKGDYIIICGGAGVLNIRPFLEYVDVFVFGRGEETAPKIVKEYEKGGRYQDESVVWAKDFDLEKEYYIAQAKELYPYKVELPNGFEYEETALGCPNKCSFCAYTWHRDYIGDGTYQMSKLSNRTTIDKTERTIADLLKIPVENWSDDGLVKTIGLDGMSERLRFRVNKKISSEMYRNVLRGLIKQPKTTELKVFCVIGYPTESKEDWLETLEDIKAAEPETFTGEKQEKLLYHFTPFRAMPATPAATWEMPKENLRGLISKTLKKPNMPGNVFYQGKAFWALESFATDHLYAVILSALVLRGVEKDSRAVDKIINAKGFDSLRAYKKVIFLDKILDIDNLFRKYTKEDLPTKYLKNGCKEKERANDKARS